MICKININKETMKENSNYTKDHEITDRESQGLLNNYTNVNIFNIIVS